MSTDENEIVIFATEAISVLNKKITDEVFLLIQSDRELMRQYLDLVANNGVATTNRLIGKTVKNRYGLDNASHREHEPKSTLILSHQAFE